jgi:hypothetical protein
MSMIQKPSVFNQQIQEAVALLQTAVRDGAEQGRAIHEVERAIWQSVLALGKHCLGQFLALHGDGDMGPTLTTPQGQQWQRLPERHSRRYVSIFGVFELERVVYGSREGQKIEFVPLDNRLQLPASVYSYVLQDWSQSLCVESAFSKVADTLQRFLGLKLSVDGLEHTNADMAERVADYRCDRLAPPPETEGELLVLSADGKGIVMRRADDEPAPASHRTKGEKASKKQMATVASVYSVDRYRRTAEEVVAALFRDARDQPPPPRPKPQHKHVWASLPRRDAEGETSSIDLVFPMIQREVIERNRRHGEWLRPMVSVNDGQEALWQARAHYVPFPVVDVLDFLHVTPRLWQAAHVFHPEGSDAAEAFVRQRCLRLLQGGVSGVIGGLREMATKQGLTAAKKKTITQICGYFKKNQKRMRYDDYLAEGYPIASGIIEGACRHLIRDRMERAGMHWTVAGAQAMLEVRSVYVNGDWDAYQTYRIGRELYEIYPQRAVIEGPLYTMTC